MEETKREGSQTLCMIGLCSRWLRKVVSIIPFDTEGGYPTTGQTRSEPREIIEPLSLNRFCMFQWLEAAGGPVSDSPPPLE